MALFHCCALYSHRGGSGLAVVGPPTNRGPGPRAFDGIVQKASEAQQDGGVPPTDSNRRIITLYRNGFTVDDGPLRDLESPESRAFISSLERGEAPRGLHTPRTSYPVE
jgi:UBX domain-containing protein 1